MNNTQEVVKTVSNYVNSMSADYNGFAKEFACQHRTLQQNFTKLCVAWLKELAETQYYDLRNEASIEFAKGIKEQLDNTVLPLI